MKKAAIEIFVFFYLAFTFLIQTERTLVWRESFSSTAASIRRASSTIESPFSTGPLKTGFIFHESKTPSICRKLLRVSIRRGHSLITRLACCIPCLDRRRRQCIPLISV